MAAVPGFEAERARRRRVRNSAILWALVAGGFYLFFIVLSLVRAHR